VLEDVGYRVVIQAWERQPGVGVHQPGQHERVRWDSATMIGPDLLLTCGHLFDADPNGWTIPRQNGTTASEPGDVR